MSSQTPNGSDLENNKTAEQAEPAQKSCCTRLGEWFWGPNLKEYINPDFRPVISYQKLQLFRIILLSLLVVNTIYRIIYTAVDGISTFGRYQLYFTTWSLYVTIYVEFWVVFTSKYNRSNPVNFETGKQLLVLKHNHIWMILALAMETVTTIIYWTSIYDYDSDFSLREASGMLDHILPMVILAFDFFCTGWVFYQRQTVVIFFLLSYFPFNIGYSILGPRDLYDIMPWDTVMSYVFVIVILGIAFGGHALYALYSQWRYRKNSGGEGNKNEISKVSHHEASKVDQEKESSQA